MRGWIKAHRSLRDHWLWQDKPFSQGQAWIDILFLANHSGNRLLSGTEVKTIPRGEFYTSIRNLCDAWGWSNTKVKRFLTALQSDQMIDVKSDSKKTVIKVLNYNEYQDISGRKNDTETTLKHQQSDTKTSQKHTNKNVKNIKNIKNEENERNITTSSMTGLRAKFDWSRFSESELSEVYPFGRCKGLNLTVAEVALLYQTIPDAYVERYLIKVQNYSCKDVFETIVSWALQDGVIDFNKAS